MPTLKGCAVHSKITFFNAAFGEGDIVFLKTEAQRGLLRRVAIKTVEVRTEPSFTCTGVGISSFYFSTLNACYTDADLVSHSDAIALAIAYYENLITVAQEAISLGCL